MRSLVLDLAVNPAAADAVAATLGESVLRLRLADLREIGTLGALRRIRQDRFDRAVLVVNDVRAQRRWPSVIALALASRAASREVVDPDGRSRPVTWSSALFAEIPFVIRRAWAAAGIRRRARREAGRLRPAGPARQTRPSSVAFLRADLTPELDAGGSLAHIHGVLSGFEKLGCRVTFVTPGRVRGLPEDGDRVHRVPPSEIELLLPELPYLTYNDCLPRLDEIVRSSGADLVYHRHALGHYAAALVAQACGVPLVVEFNGSEVWIARNWGDGLPHTVLFEEIERRALQAADLVVAVSEPLRRQLLEAGVPADRILVNPNGVDAARFDPDRLRQERVEIRSRLGIGEEELLVGFVGTFGPWHGAEVLAEAAGRVEPAWRDRLRYLFIGDGERRAATQSILSASGLDSRSSFAGLVPQDETPALLAACDLCASPHVPNPDGTPFFGSPTKLFEYMASGRAVVASRLGQIAEVLENDRNAWLVPPGDPDRLARALQHLAGDDGLRRRLGEAARADAIERHSWTSHVQRILDHLAGPGTSPDSGVP